ncbi:unnamed protein product [Symbiodinium sp. CCMP2592]|nr:unnamed protein product [Symbiodinium sp. CCMP2592]
MGAAKDTVVNTGCSSLLWLAFLLHVGDSLGIALPQSKEAKTSPSYIVADVASYIASLPRSRHHDEEALVQGADVARSRATLQAAATTQDRALLEEAFEIREESRMEAENARGANESGQGYVLFELSRFEEQLDRFGHKTDSSARSHLLALGVLQG